MKELIECEYSGVDIHGALVGFLRKIQLRIASV